MTRQEFEDLIGRKAEEVEYVQADTLYNMTDMSKQDFCGIWRLTGYNAIYEELLNKVSARDEVIHDMKEKNEQASSWLLSALQSKNLADGIERTQVNKALVLIISYEKAIVYKLKRQMPLSSKEIEYVESCLY